MSPKVIRTAKIAVVVFFSFMLCTVFGFREGQFAFYMIDALPKGVVSMVSLKALEKGNDTPLKLALNTDIDQGLYFYSIVQDEW